MAEPTSICICICIFLFLCICFFGRICICFCFRFFLCFFRNTSASAASSSSSSASTLNAPSSSASILNTPYDVFINHRGPDVKKTLASLLYRDLQSKGLQVFLDLPELEPGHIIRSQIEAAIQGASVHIAIFSENYAESNWCLDELVLMLDSKGTILPVFYKVKPTDLRWPDKGAYADALRGHEKKKRYDLQIIQGWKKALSSVADISGFELEACNGDLVELVDKVIQRVLKEVPKPPLFVAKHKIGLQEKLEEFERTVLSQLEGQGRLEAKVVGIVGSGGIGKSTLARDFFNSKRSNYNFSSFLFDVRENTATKSLIHLQRELIEDIKGEDVQIKSWEEGIGICKKKLKSCHALIILDDVDHLRQLDALLPIKDALDPMSLILITSRDKQVLRKAKITDSSIYQLKGLDRPHSLELFCSHAFFHPHPKPEFEGLVDGFLKACDGLPLSLEVFGALLCQQNDRSYWEEQLNGLEKLPSDIQVRLKISYDSLDPEEQQIFLDIACFSIGEDKDKWIRIWSGSGWKGSVGLRNLENKCLVEVVEEVPWGYAYSDKINAIRMHDHLRDLGRSIAKEGSMPRRLWNATINDVYDLLEQSSSVTEVRGIKMASQSTMSDTWEGSFSDELFSRISKLQLLEAEGDLVEGILSKVRSRNLNLIWLRWKKCPGSSLPSCIPMRDLRVLEVDGKDLERLWAPESQAPLLLRELNIVNAPLLEALPNSIDNLMSLQKINLGNCKSLKVLPNAFGTLTNLREIDMWGCISLEALPNSIDNLMSMQKIVLGYCESLKVLPNAFGTLTNLREISLWGCTSLEALPNSIDNLMSMQMISLGFCESLKVLPNAFGTLTNLREINLRGCKSLEELPNSIDNLTSLQNIDLGYCGSLKVLPNAFGALTNLREINLQGCTSLEALPNSIDNLMSLQNINLGCYGSLKVLPNAFGALTNLREINLQGCTSLEALPSSIDNLMSLQNICLQECVSLKVLPNAFGTLTNLTKINLRGCKSLEALPNSIDNLMNLTKINLWGCKSLEALPNSIDNLMSLQEIDLADCESLKVLPNAFGTLTNLREINLQGCTSLEALPNSIDNLMSLQNICLRECVSLKVLPNAFGTLTNLRKINLQGCTSLEALPNSIENLINLQKIDLGNCESLKVLPNAFGTLTNLRKINLQGCTSLEALPSSIENLTNLQEIHLGNCESLKVLPNAFVNLLQLTHLHLNCCRSLTISNETFGNITTLECLDLSGCLQMEALPLQVVRNTSLKMLNLLNTNIKELPSAPTVCPSNLEYLILGSPLLKVISPWLGCLTNLKALLLHGCLELKCLPDSIGQLSQIIVLRISKCGMQYLPPAVMQLNNLRILTVRRCPLLELPFKRVEGEGEPSLLTEFSQGRELDCMIQLEEIHLYLTEISEVSFPQGVCPNLKKLKIRWCNDLVEVAALPTTLRRLDLSGCGALRKIGGLSALANLEKLDIRRCCALEVEELPGLETVISMDILRTILRSLRSLKTPLETYYPNEEEKEEQIMEDLQKGVIQVCGRMFSEDKEE